MTPTGMMSKRQKRNLQREGYAARCNGLTVDACLYKYVPGDGLRHHWLIGWWKREYELDRPPTRAANSEKLDSTGGG